MSKQQEDANFLKIQTCVLKVNIHCDGCKQKVKKLLQKVVGVYTTAIDSEQGKVTVSGNVDPASLIKKLAKSGKHAELLAPKPNNHHNQKQQQPAVNGGKGQQHKDNGKPQNQKAGGGGGGGGKDQQKGQLPSLPPQQQQQMKGFKDLKLSELKDLKFPFQKDPKSVKFALPPEEGGSDLDGFDDYDDDDDEDDFDDMDCFDADFDDDFKTLRINKPVNGNGMKGGCGHGGGNAKKVEIPVQNKRMDGKHDPRNGNGGKKGGAGNNNNNGGSGGGSKNGGGGHHDAKNGESNNNKTKNAPNGNGGNNYNNNTKGGGAGKNDLGVMGHPMNHPNPNPNPNIMMMGQNFKGMRPPQAMGNIPVAVQGLPASAMPPAYFQGQMAAAANPHQQQQYMQAMMQQQLQQQQQQQRMMMMVNGQDQMHHYQPMMGYPHPPPQALYMLPPPPPQSEPYTHFFSDENTNSCSVM